jgi:sulfotransferase
MMKKLALMCGFPRSGSTLLANLLMQNPDVYVSSTSGLPNLIGVVRDFIDQGQMWKAMPPHERQARKFDILRGVLQGRYAFFEGSVCIDKSRGWPELFEQMGALIGKENVKAIVCVRDLRDVVASFEKLFRRTSAESVVPQQRKDPVAYASALGRIRHILKPDEPVGYSVNVVRDAILRGWRPNMLFVDYNNLCQQPIPVLASIYGFLGEPFYEGHNAANVEQVTREDDSLHGYVGLHDIRPRIIPQAPQWPVVFDDTVTRSAFWSELTELSGFWREPRPQGGRDGRTRHPGVHGAERGREMVVSAAGPSSPPEVAEGSGGGDEGLSGEVHP